MTVQTSRAVRLPRFVGFFNPIAARLLRRGLPLGPNALLTVRGRKSGVPRTTPVALVETGGRRWVVGTFGPVNWVRNLRETREAVISVRGVEEKVAARELTREEAGRFFADVLGPYVRKLPVGRMVLRLLGASEILDDPIAAADLRPVFELIPG